jgi:hypothetical protein
MNEETYYYFVFIFIGSFIFLEVLRVSFVLLNVFYGFTHNIPFDLIRTAYICLMFTLLAYLLFSFYVEIKEEQVKN